jgi:hypothetical protein
MIEVGTRLRKMMTMSRGFRTVPMGVCGLRNLNESTSLVEFRRENTYSFVGALEKNGF